MYPLSRLCPIGKRKGGDVAANGRGSGIAVEKIGSWSDAGGQLETSSPKRLEAEVVRVKEVMRFERFLA